MQEQTFGISGLRNINVFDVFLQDILAKMAVDYERKKYSFL